MPRRGLGHNQHALGHMKAHITRQAGLLLQQPCGSTYSSGTQLQVPRPVMRWLFQHSVGPAPCRRCHACKLAGWLAVLCMDSGIEAAVVVAACEVGCAAGCKSWCAPAPFNAAPEPFRLKELSRHAPLVRPACVWQSALQPCCAGWLLLFILVERLVSHMAWINPQQLPSSVWAVGVCNGLGGVNGISPCGSAARHLCMCQWMCRVSRMLWSAMHTLLQLALC